MRLIALAVLASLSTTPAFATPQPVRLKRIVDMVAVNSQPGQVIRVKGGQPTLVAEAGLYGPEATNLWLETQITVEIGDSKLPHNTVEVCLERDRVKISCEETAVLDNQGHYVVATMENGSDAIQRNMMQVTVLTKSDATIEQVHCSWTLFEKMDLDDGK